MTGKEKISAVQIEFMMVPTIIGTGLLSIPAIAAKLALHDMWLTPLFGAITGYITVFIVWKIYKLYPTLTPYQYSEEILGKWIGKIVGLVFVFFYIQNCGLIVRQYSDFITSNVMHETPLVAFSTTLLFISGLAVRGGIEVVARSSVICSGIYIAWALVVLFIINKIDLGQLLPFLENGPLPLIKGSMIHSSWYSEFFLLAFLLPYLNNQKAALKAGMKSVFYVMVLLFYVSFFVLTLFGLTSMNQLYPVYTMIRSLSLFGFFENFEVLVTAAWVLGNYVKTSVFLYVSCIGIAQIFRLSDYRLIVFPVCLLILLFSYWNVPNIVFLIHYMFTIQPFYFMIVQTFLPFVLLMVGMYRKKRRGNQ